VLEVEATNQPNSDWLPFFESHKLLDGDDIKRFQGDQILFGKHQCWLCLSMAVSGTATHVETHSRKQMLGRGRIKSQKPKCVIARSTKTCASMDGRWLESGNASYITRPKSALHLFKIE
jgi:hypothetical protein